MRAGDGPHHLADAPDRVTYLGALTSYRIQCGQVRLLAQSLTTADEAFRAGDGVVVEWGERDGAIQL